MTTCVDESGELKDDEFRLTRFGKLLRDWSIDELPQLWNVVIGDMSLIGPRPFIAEYASRYTAEQMRRHEVRPGISGWAQITGRNSLSWDQKFTLDVWYVDHCSFMLDLKIPSFNGSDRSKSCWYYGRKPCHDATMDGK
jgi:lipopolysaccharide/colanic/teichoic acid biosynthesis glycosyltransferase